MREPVVIPDEYRRRAYEYLKGMEIMCFRTYGVHYTDRKGKVNLVSWYDLSRHLGYSPEESEFHL